jgi:hypothetical protein
MADAPEESELLEQAQFVFKGTVRQANASAIPAIEASEHTAVVRVDQIVQAPAALSHYGGQEITVLLAGDERVKTGDEFTFFTNEWLYGKGVAVRSLGQLPASASTATFAAAGPDPVRTLAHRQLVTRVDDADLVVSGRVTSVSLPEGEGAGAPGAQSPRRLAPREHDPHWREAVVEVSQVHKGEHPGKTVVVRFPSSHDRMWFSAPKLAPGQEGHFVLHKSGRTRRVEGPALAAGAPAAAAVEDVYSVVHPEDFQSIAQPGGLKSVLNLPE